MSIIPSERDKGRNEATAEMLADQSHIYSALTRLCALVHGDDVLSEGQLVAITGISRIEVRRLVDDGRESISATPLPGLAGRMMMQRIGLTS